MNKFTIPLLTFAVLVGFLAVGLTLKPRELPSPFLGQPAPPFALPQLLAPTEFASTDLRGQVWLLNVWASWCAACRDEHPLLLRLARTGSVPIVGLNYKDAATDAAAWLQRFGNPYAHIPQDTAGHVGIDYGVYGVPETYLIDKTGVIRFKQIGPLTAEIMRRLLPMITRLREDPA